MLNLVKKVFGTKNDRTVKKLENTVLEINSLEPKMESLSDEELAAQTTLLREKIANGATLDSILPEAFATVREASKRAVGMRHFDVQLIGGIVLHQGRIAEMKTGEGKTLTATAPVYLHALAGKGAHVITVNDYLAQRDAEWMGKIYKFLGLSVATIVHGMDDAQRKEAYNCDITYGTNNEFGFDYLRDNMKTDPERMVQREFSFGIVDEVDSILIDEARTPLIISGPAESNLGLYKQANTAVIGLQKDSDYIVDEKSRTVSLTEDGINKLENRLRIQNLYEPSNIDILHHTQQALKANIIFKKDVDYVVRNNQVIIVDEHTGRLMPGRRYSDGLHGALEAKENVTVQNETQTLATITFQNFFRMYNVLSGMTGTADTEAVEFQKIYNLDVVVIPTNKPLARKDNPDVVYRTAKEKFNAIADEIAKAQKKGQPVLVGTVSVEKSELVSQLLKKRQIPHEILNAKHHGNEASIIKDAGQSGHVTISTNMAGRGTDIVLGDGVKEAGGLLVIGTERHESRRIDNQLRGRSGRQGDPGESKFFLSLEDDLMRIFASDRLSGIMARLGMEEGEAIISPMVSRAIERAQKRVEEQNFSSRKHLLEYDDVMNQQRQVVYTQRRAALHGESEIDFFDSTVNQIAHDIAQKKSPEASDESTWDLDAIKSEAQTELGVEINLAEIDSSNISPEAIAQVCTEQTKSSYESKYKDVPNDIKKKIESLVFLQIIDSAWKDHLLAMDALKDSVSLRGYGQRDPLQEYKKEAFVLFQSMWGRVQEECITSLIRMPAPQLMAEPQTVSGPDESQMSFQHPTAASPTDVKGGEADKGNEDSLIYHGSRNGGGSASRQQQNKPQTFKREVAKVGRNDLCPCGSGKKYKKCHGKLGSETHP